MNQGQTTVWIHAHFSGSFFMCFSLGVRVEKGNYRKERRQSVTGRELSPAPEIAHLLGPKVVQAPREDASLLPIVTLNDVYNEASGQKEQRCSSSGQRKDKKRFTQRRSNKDTDYFHVISMKVLVLCHQASTRSIRCSISSLQVGASSHGSQGKRISRLRKCLAIR